MAKQSDVLLLIALIVPVVLTCCIPKQWEGLQGVAVGAVKDGQPMATEALFNISFDETNQKLFLAGSVIANGMEVAEMVLQDYAMKTQYVVINGKCTKTALATPFPPSCTSPDAKKLLTTYYGINKDKLMVEVYNDMMDGKKTYFTAMKGSCVPVSVYQQAGDSVSFINYMGITPGISNMTIFNVPKECMNVNIIEKTEDQNHRGTVFLR